LMRRMPKTLLGATCLSVSNALTKSSYGSNADPKQCYIIYCSIYSNLQR
jgi:hypothetical protein